MFLKGVVTAKFLTLITNIPYSREKDIKQKCFQLCFECGDWRYCSDNVTDVSTVNIIRPSVIL